MNRWILKDLEQALLIGSTLVEGSTLTETEAKSVLAGRTVHGHAIAEARELLNYRAAVEWLLKQVSKSPYLSHDLLLEFHRRLFTGFPGEHGRLKTLPNYTYLSNGTRFDYLHPAQVNGALRTWLDRFNTEPLDKSPVLQAAQLYYEFQQIHPFEDGNGRIGRICVAYWLHWKTKLFFSFRLKDKVDHLKALESAGAGDFEKLETFFKKRCRKETK